MAVYVIHFEKKLHHAQHYVGYAENIIKRNIRHLNGFGAKIRKSYVRYVNRLKGEWERNES